MSGCARRRRDARRGAAHIHIHLKDVHLSVVRFGDRVRVLTLPDVPVVAARDVKNRTGRSSRCCISRRSNYAGDEKVLSGIDCRGRNHDHRRNPARIAQAGGPAPEPSRTEKRDMTLRGIAGGAALVVLLAAGQARAAWNNAFQVCWHRNPTPSYSAPPAPAVAHSSPNPCCPPPPCCTTCYVQRCYYQPVTSYKTVCEPVTTYKTSYYWEPVCGYRTSNYVDPCTGCCV